jgi:predicted ATPase
VVDWSYDLLFEDERRLFARLSVFTGGCDLDAAEAVCADDQVPAGEILDVLSRLVDKSLVAAPDVGRDTRFAQLQTLWQYGRDRLDESGETGAMCARHGAYYRQMAEEAHEGLRGATGPMWRERLTAEHAGWVTLSARRGRAGLNWPRPPRSGTGISCAWRSALPLAFPNATRRSPPCGPATTGPVERRPCCSAPRC